MNILFVCSQNKWRSRTAETIFKNHGQHQVRSAGTERGARIRVSQSLIDWADRIFVMEDRHKRRLLAQFDVPSPSSMLEVLHIPDDYRYLDAELIEILEVQLADVFFE